jgi:hypothetical protein
MGEIKTPAPVKLFVGMISNQPKVFKTARAILKKKYGSIDFQSQIIKFDFTSYYQDELGKNLFRQFVGFKKLIDPAKLPSIKLFTNKIESDTSRKNGSRRINLDPGYITESNLVLATTKSFQHRIYLNSGIYAEVTLRYEKGEYKAYWWTYHDYQTREYHNFFKALRNIYREQLEISWKKQKNTGA